MLQDERAVAPDWQFTVGVRYDDYSDFGSTINPRLSLVWATDYDLSTKLLYGRAFRAPSLAGGEMARQRRPHPERQLRLPGVHRRGYRPGSRLRTQSSGLPARRLGDRFTLVTQHPAQLDW
ncbi:hypothetical protein JCM17961_28000 [Endothiovibrio diazotrophicus]